VPGVLSFTVYNQQE